MKDSFACTRCHAAIPAGAKFCLSCGLATKDSPDIPVCLACGAAADRQDSKFCTLCGGEIRRAETAARFCTQCGQALPAAAVFCPGCGTPTAAAAKSVKKCDGCGAALKPGAAFCPSCGATAIPTTAQPPPTPPAAPPVAPPTARPPARASAPTSAVAPPPLPAVKAPTASLPPLPPTAPPALPPTPPRPKPQPQPGPASPKPAPAPQAPAPPPLPAAAAPAESASAKPKPAALTDAVPPRFLRGGWMMLFAGLSATAANIWHQTAIMLWELAIGGPILIVTAIFMIRLRGGWRFLGALLSLGPAAWAVWQLDTYLPIIPEFVAKSWPLFCFMPISAVLAILATLRCWRSLISQSYTLVPGQPPRKRRAIGGIVFALLIVGGITAVGFLPDEDRRPALMTIWGRELPSQKGRAPTPPPPPPEKKTSRTYDLNPVMPPMTSTGTESSPPSRVPARPTAPNQTPRPNLPPPPPMEPTPPPPAERSGIANRTIPATTPARNLPAPLPVEPPPVEPPPPPAAHAASARSYPSLAADLARSPATQDVAFAATAGRSSFRVSQDAQILERKINPDGTESLQVRCTTSAEDFLGRQRPGWIVLDVLMDSQGRILRSQTAEVRDAEREQMLAPAKR